MKPLATLVRLAVTSCLLITAVAAQAAATFEMQGFRGISWGDSAKRLGDSVLVSSTKGSDCYRRSDENLMFGDSTLQSVRYCFHADRLFKVTLDAKSGFSALATEFQSTYGRPRALADRRATWGSARSPTRAELSAASSASTGSTLAIYAPRFAPATN